MQHLEMICTEDFSSHLWNDMVYPLLALLPFQSLTSFPSPSSFPPPVSCPLRPSFPPPQDLASYVKTSAPKVNHSVHVLRVQLPPPRRDGVLMTLSQAVIPRQNTLLKCHCAS